MPTIKPNKLIRFQIPSIFIAVILVTGGIAGSTFGVSHVYADKGYYDEEYATTNKMLAEANDNASNIVSRNGNDNAGIDTNEISYYKLQTAGTLQYVYENIFLPNLLSNTDTSTAVPSIVDESDVLLSMQHPFGLDDSITVLNEQSYPQVGGFWIVDFTVQGTHDLVITPINGTTFGTYPDDVEFVSLNDGNGDALLPQWVYTDNGTAKSIKFPNYSNDKTGSFKMLVNTAGKHHLKFEFGSGTVYANNDATSISLFHTSFDSAFSVASQDTAPTGLFFNSDGTKMFVTGNQNDSVHEYTLSTGFDVSTATFVGSFSVASQDTDPTGLSFNSDGTKMFVTGNQNDSIYEYTLSTAFDVSNATSVDSFSVAAQDTEPSGLFFNSDGTKMFVTGNQNDSIYEYTLSTAFDVSTATFVGSFSVASQDTDPTGLSFNSDGTKMFVTGNQNDSIYEYTLSTAFDVSTATFVDSFSVAAQDTEPTGIFFSSDGTKMSVTGNQNDSIYEYTLSTAFDVSTATFVDSFSVAAQDTEPTDIDFSSDGARMFVTGNQNDSVHEYVLSTAFDVSTATFVDSFSVAAQDTEPSGLFFISDGTKLFVIGNAGEAVYEYTLATKFTLFHTTFVDSFSVAAQDTEPSGLFFSSNGTKMFVTGSENDSIYEYTLSTGFNVSTATFVNSLPFEPQQTEPTGIDFNSDGTKMFVTWNKNDSVHEYTLSTTFDISTATFVDSFSVASQSTAPTGIDFNSDGTKMFVIGNQNDSIYEYTLSPAFDVSTATFVDSFSVASQETEPLGLSFNSDGTKMFVTGNAGDAVYEYALSTAFNVSTATFVGSFSVASQDTEPTGIDFNSDGTKMFVIGNVGDDVNEYNINFPDVIKPTFASAALNEETGVLDITFSEIIDIASVDLSKLFISDPGNADEIALTGATITTGSDSDIVSITLTGAQRMSVIALTTPELDINAAAVADISGNTINVAADQTISVTVDSTKPTFTAKTGPATNQITITFSENVDSPSDESSQWEVDGKIVAGVTTLDGITNTLTITLDTALSAGATPDVTYTAGDIADASGNTMDTATVVSANGLSPNVLSARISTDTITIIYDRQVNTVLDDYSDLTTSDESTPTLTSITGSGARVIAITISSEVPAGTTGTIDISSGVKSVGGVVPIDPVNDQNITAEDIVTLSGSDDTIAVTESDSILSTITYPSALISKINFTAIAVGDTVTTNKQITATMTGSTGGNTELRLAANTTITGTEFTGNISAPSNVGFDMCGIVSTKGALESCIQVGQSGTSLSISPPARIALSGQAGNVPWFKTDAGLTTEITTACTADTLTAATSQLIPGPPNECYINVGSDLVIWTNHFTQFGSSILPPSGGGGSSGDQTPPSIVTTFEDMGYPVTIDDSSYTAEQLKDPASTKIVETEEPVLIELLLYENGGPQNVKYVEMYVNRHGTLILNDLTETLVIWDDDKGVDIINPNGIISDATVERTIQDNKVLFTFDVTFAKEFDTSDIVFNVWDSKRNGLKFAVIDALQVIPREPTAFLEDPAIKTVDQQKDLAESTPIPEPDATAVVPEPDATAVVPEPDATAVVPEPDATAVVPEPDATAVVPEPDATAVVPEPGVDVWSEDQKLVIEMWVGYHPESTSDYYLLKSVYFDTYGKNVDTTDYVIPSWVKKHLATWTLSEKVNFEDFVNAIKYLHGKNLF